MKDPAKVQDASSKAEDAKKAVPAAIRWDDPSDSFLRSIVTMTGIRDWEKVASMMRAQFTGRDWTASECKDRWYSVLEPMISKKPWTEQEELEMLVAHKMCQNKWSNVSALLQGRINNTIKNRFYSIFRKVKNKVKRSETIFNSRIELLEIFYMMAQMELHLSQPFPPIPHKGKRGKDFVYTLLQNLHIEEIEKYRTDLALVSRKRETLQDLWDELAVPIEQAKVKLTERINTLAGKNTCIPLNQFVAHVETGLYQVMDQDRQRYVLPKPDGGGRAGTLNEEEKGFVQTFMSKNPQTPMMPSGREIASTGTHMCCHATAPTPELIAVQPFSAGMRVMPMAFQGFSDYTTLARKGSFPMQQMRLQSPMSAQMMSVPMQVQMFNPQGMAVSPPIMYQSCIQGTMLPYPVMRPPAVMPQAMHPAPSMGMYRPRMPPPY